MHAHSYFQLTGTLVFAVFAVAFVLIWRHVRDTMPVRHFALAFFLGACATFADFMRASMPPVVALHVLNLLYLAMEIVFVSAVYRLYDSAVPCRFLAFLSVFGAAGLSWFILVDDNIAARLVIMNGGGALATILPAFALRQRMVRPIDRVLQAALVVIGLCIGARAGIVLLAGPGGMTNENYAQSMTALSLHFILVLSALTIAIILFVMTGMQIVKRLTRASETDPLTGVLNRRGLETRLPALAESRAGHAVVMADIDHFKHINDRFGHEAGDAVIRLFARILAGTLRESDVVVRWGGEEFLVVLRDADVPTARRFAEAVRIVFGEEAPAIVGGREVTASFGIAAWDGRQAISTISHLADKALYRAKRGGRNRVCQHAPGAAEENARAAAA
ncbi:GGDEF domain-containing protein [Oricola thermophila]|uniref:diguanylate cyclase n=1 Tax=Oricola thermophila TaxID=2742145 RepID=A0A6N1VGC0_9HYPH|nr:GGDEF domain-containing protein [Oricola thermophila]QKV19970.1 GGDEF domain-containing protein [Oricola thermophila]